MTEARGWNKQSRLNFITLHALNQLRQQLFNKARGVRYVPAETPPDLIKLAYDAVAFKLQEAINRNLRVPVRYGSGSVPAARAVEQIFRFNLSRNLTKARVAADNFSIERICAVDVRARRRDERQIHHRQCAPRRSKGRVLVLNEGVIPAHLASRATACATLLPPIVTSAPFVNS